MTDAPKHPALNPWTVEGRIETDYPEPFRALVAGRHKRALGDALGLTQFGVNLVTLAPGTASGQRHWHSREDEFVFVLRGKVTLVTDAGEQELGPGMAAGYPAGAADAHHLVNRTDEDAVYLEVGTRDPADECDYPDIDLLLRVVDGEQQYVHKNGTPYKNG